MTYFEILCVLSFTHAIWPADAVWTNPEEVTRSSWNPSIHHFGWWTCGSCNRRFSLPLPAEYGILRVEAGARNPLDPAGVEHSCQRKRHFRREKCIFGSNRSENLAKSWSARSRLYHIRFSKLSVYFAAYSPSRRLKLSCLRKNEHRGQLKISENTKHAAFQCGGQGNRSADQTPKTNGKHIESAVSIQN